MKSAENDKAPALHRCSSIHILNLDGPMFFGASTELESALKRARREHDCKVLILRLKRTENLDYTTSQTLVRGAWNMREEQRHLLLVGMQPAARA